MFGLMGGRIRYWDPPNQLQSDGARVRRWSGVAVNVNNGCQPGDVAMPDPASIDYICGASMVASRAFIDTVGLMEDDYFLYYEEVDWAARRGALPFRLCADAIVLHHAGASIGSGNLGRAPTAFSQYFNYRNRLRFMLRFRPMAAPVTWLWSMGQIAKLAVCDGVEPAIAALCGLNQLPPPAAIQQRMSAQAAALAFKRKPS
jgi:GT2 family glycosyltransferase